MKHGRIHVIQGGQYGSEGKGAVAAAMAQNADAAVRTGSINAGHTVYYQGKAYAMQTIPTAWVHDGVPLFIGPGAYIHPDILEREIHTVCAATGKDIRDRLFIDYRCMLHTPKAEATAKDANRHHAMGATGKGSSEALIQKLRERGNPDTCHQLAFMEHELADTVQIADVSTILNDIYRMGGDIVLEGTQGSHLDFYLGPYPFVSNRGCNAALWLAEAGIPPSFRTETSLVCRTMPIRVAGVSGPLPNEVSWFALATRLCAESKLPGLVDMEALFKWDDFCTVVAREMGVLPDLCDPYRPEGWDDGVKAAHRAAVSEVHSRAFKMLSEEEQAGLSIIEKTTVTKKPRRIGFWDIDTVKQAITWNDPNQIVLTFLNYQFPDLWEATELHDEAKDAISSIQDQTNVKVSHTSTGPLPEQLLTVNV